MPVTIFRRVNVPSVADFDSSTSASEWFGSLSLSASRLPLSLLPPGAPLSLWGAPLDHWCAGERCALREAIETSWSYDSQIASYHVPLLWPAPWRISKAVLAELPEPWRPISTAVIADIDWPRERKKALAAARADRTEAGAAVVENLENDLREWRERQMTLLLGSPFRAGAAWWWTPHGIHVAWETEPWTISEDSEIEIENRRRGMFAAMRECGLDVELSVDWTHMSRSARPWRDGKRLRLPLDTSALGERIIDLREFPEIEPVWNPTPDDEKNDTPERRRRRTRVRNHRATALALRSGVHVESIHRRAIAYAERMEASVEGSGGDLQLWRCCLSLAQHFALLPEEIVAVLIQSGWNARCAPPWSQRELLLKARRTPYRVDGNDLGGYLRDSGDRIDWTEDWLVEASRLEAIFNNSTSGVVDPTTPEAGRGEGTCNAVAQTAHEEPGDLALRAGNSTQTDQSGRTNPTASLHSVASAIRGESAIGLVPEGRTPKEEWYGKLAAFRQGFEHASWTASRRRSFSIAKRGVYMDDGIPGNHELMRRLQRSIACEGVRAERAGGKHPSLCEVCNGEVREYHCDDTILCSKCASRHGWLEGESFVATAMLSPQYTAWVGLRLVLNTTLIGAFSAHRGTDVEAGRFGDVDRLVNFFGDKRMSKESPRVAWVGRGESHIWRDEEFPELMRLSIPVTFIWGTKTNEEAQALIYRLYDRLALGEEKFDVRTVDNGPMRVSPVDVANEANTILGNVPEWTADWRVTEAATRFFANVHCARRNVAMQGIWHPVTEIPDEPQQHSDQYNHQIEIAWDRIIAIGQADVQAAVDRVQAWRHAANRWHEGSSPTQTVGTFGLAGTTASVRVPLYVGPTDTSIIAQMFVNHFEARSWDQRKAPDAVWVDRDAGVTIWDMIEAMCIRHGREAAPAPPNQREAS